MMKLSKRCCFVVLRRSGPLIDLDAGVGKTGRSRRYGGIDRHEWDDFDQAHYAKLLPDALEESWVLLDSCRDSLGFRSASYDMAKMIADFSSGYDPPNEICAMQVLDGYDDTPSSSDDMAVEWSGMDIFVDGYGSAILQGIFARPDLFADFQSTLNSFGLFDFHEPRVREYQQAVIKIGRANGSNIEVMPEIDDLWHAIAVGRFTVGANQHVRF